MKRWFFPKYKRLTSNEQFKRVMSENIRADDGLLTVFSAPNELEYPRLGVSIRSSFGKAVVRNRLKRLIKEAFRRNQHKITCNCDYVVMISAGLSNSSSGSKRNNSNPLYDLTCQQIEESLLKLAQKTSARLQ